VACQILTPPHSIPVIHSHPQLFHSAIGINFISYASFGTGFALNIFPAHTFHTHAQISSRIVDKIS